jgi:hypothetical protein
MIVAWQSTARDPSLSRSAPVGCGMIWIGRSPYNPSDSTKAGLQTRVATNKRQTIMPYPPGRLVCWAHPWQ